MNDTRSLDCKDATKSTQLQLRLGDLGVLQVRMTGPVPSQFPSLRVSMAARWELCTLQATSPVWVSQEHSRAQMPLHTVGGTSEGAAPDFSTLGWGLFGCG